MSKKDISETVECLGCCEELRISHMGVKCKNNHHICDVDCAQNFVHSWMENPEANFPVRCPICKAEVIESTFMMQLDSA